MKPPRHREPAVVNPTAPICGGSPQAASWATAWILLRTRDESPIGRPTEAWKAGPGARGASRGIRTFRVAWFGLLAWMVCGFTAVRAQEQPASDPPPSNPPAATPPAEGEAPAAEEGTPVNDAASDEFSDLPKLEELKKPQFEELMAGPPVDWLLFNQERVLRVEPVLPRPRTVEQINDQVKKAAPKAGQAETEAAKRKRLSLFQLPVTLLEGEDREYTVHVKYLRGIVYHEDMILEEIDRLIGEGLIRKAYELLVMLEERDAQWPGLVQRREKLLFADARIKLEKQQPEHALALLESLHGQNASYPGLADLFGKVMGSLINPAVERSAFREARFFLKRGQRTLPEHPVLVEATEKLTQSSLALLEQAQQAEQRGERVQALDLAEQASRVWPGLPELVTPFARISNRWQRLRVGVTDLPRGAPVESPLLRSPGEIRRQQLLRGELFQPVRFEDRIVRFRSRFLTDWEPRELGHSLLLRLKPYRSTADSQPALSAFELSRLLAERILPGGPRYDARLAAMVERVQVRGPFELELELAQVPLRPEVWLAIPVEDRPLAPVTEGDAPVEAATTTPTQSSFPMTITQQSESEFRYQRAYAQPDGQTEYHLAEVVERFYPDTAAALQGLFRGEVSMLPTVPLSTVRQLEPRKEYFVQTYGLPTTHMLLMNPRQPALRLRTLRRALVYGLPRTRILEEVFLKEPVGELGRLTSAPWPTKSYAYAGTVAPHQYDTALGYSLARTAERELDAELPELKLWCAADPEIIAACQALATAWKRIGVTCTVHSPGPDQPLPAVESDAWDLVYRTETLAEPAAELGPLLTLSNSTSIESYGQLPAWLRRDLLELDRAGDWNSITQIMQRLHRQLWAEVSMIPLWELDDRFLCRRNIRNMPEQPIRCYQQVDRWKLDPWYPRDNAP